MNEYEAEFNLFSLCLKHMGFEKVSQDEYGPVWQSDTVTVSIMPKRNMAYRVEVLRPNGGTWRSVEMARNWPRQAVVCVVESVFRTRHEKSVTPAAK